MKIALIGATGMVGSVILTLLEERNFPVTELLLVASKKSVGKQLFFKNKALKIIAIEEAIKAKPAIAIFSAGGETSLDWAPKFTQVGTTVIDNSSVWRMDPNKKLIVPEINANILSKEDRIIANPNCSTIQLVMALAPLHKEYKMKRVIVSTYQSVSGTGSKAVKQMESEENHLETPMAYPYQIHRNVIPHCDDFHENGYTKEEMKLALEPQKILNRP